MNERTEKQMRSLLLDILSDGFNRSLSALSDAEALDLSKMRQQYKGVGSKYYDIVTREMEQTIEGAMPGVMDAIKEQNE